MQARNERRVMKQYRKYAGQLLCQALQGYYFFEDDEIEDKIIAAQKKFGNLAEDPDSNADVRNWIMSHSNLREKIGQVAYDMYSAEPKDKKNQFEKYMLDR